jgi:uncharacterized protein YciW
MESELEETNATPETDGGASTLDRLGRYLAAQDAPEPKQETQAQAQEPADSAAQTEVEPEDDGKEPVNEPQLTTSDLAKVLGIDENVLDVDDDGTLKVKTKIDGKEGAAKLADLLKTYQLEGHVNKKSMELSEREKALQTRAQEAEQQFNQRLQYAEGLANVAAQQLMQEFQSINWQGLEQQDPGQAALLRQKFQEKQAQLRGVYHNIEQNRGQMLQKQQAAQQEFLQKEAQRLPELIPEWKDPSVANKERSEIREWAIKSGLNAQDVDSITRADLVMMLRKAMLHDKLQQSKPQIENKVRTAPKLVKPGQAVPQNSEEQKIRSLRQTISKSGGKRGIAELLIAKGIVR